MIDDLLGNPHNPGFRDAMTGARDDVLHAGHYLNAAVKGEMTDVASQVSFFSLYYYYYFLLFCLKHRISYCFYF